MSYEITGYGGDPDGADLVGYQFILASGSTTNYNLCTPAPASSVVTTDPTSFTSGQDFTFSLDGYTWKIKDWTVSSGGKWSNNHKKSEFADDDDGEKGTFTAQSGVDEDAKGKPAKAY